MMVAAPNKTDDAARTDSGTRIVVGLDTSLIAREALSLAARLAASVDARLKGVFVEDENLLSLADLPFAREVSFSGEVRALDPERMLRAMRAQAESARRTLARIAAEAHVDWSFDVRRGRPLPSLAARAVREDTLVIRSPGMGTREVGRTVRAATREARADVLLVARGAGLKTALAVPAPAAQGGIYTSPPGRPVASVDEGTSPGEACSAFAETLAARIGAPFVRLAAKGRAPADLAAAARQGGVGILVVNADWLGDDDDAARLSAAAGCPVLLLGKERGPLEGPSTSAPKGAEGG
ncbi:MAG: universal stress protein [Parvibaculum sp.]